MKRITAIRVMIAALLMLLCLTQAGCRRSSMLRIRFWHSYTGAQSEQFQKIVDEYNRTVGRQRGVEIVAYYKGSTETLSSDLETLSLSELPNIISVRGEVAYSAYLQSKIVCAEDYLSHDVLNGYPDGMLNAGRFTYTTGIYYFPISSKIDLLFVNSDLMNQFTAASGADINRLETWDGIYSLAEEFHKFSGGDPFIAINDIGSYLLTVSKQNLSSIIQSGGRGINIVLNDETLKTIWDFYHKGYIRGYISDGKETGRSLMEEGKLVCILGSASDAWSLPISYSDVSGEIRRIETVACNYPQAEAAPYIIPVSTEGAVVLNKERTQCQESFVFLNWLDNNREMAKICTISKGLPVSKSVLSDGTVLAEMDSFISADGRNREITSLYSKTYIFAGSASLYSPALFNGRVGFENEISASLVEACLRDRQEYVSRTDAGEDPETVLASLDSEENFRAWLSELDRIKSRY